MAQVKYEQFEDNIDDIGTSMQHLIQQADWLLNSIRSRASNSNSSTSESNTGSSRESAHSSSNGEQAQAITIPTLSSLNREESSNDSSGSDTTIIYDQDEVMPVSASTPFPVVGDSFGQEVIVLGTPVIETRTTRRRDHQTARSLNLDTSVIDLSNYIEPEPVVIISSDEEDNAPPSTVQAPLSQPQPQSQNPADWRNNRFAISVQSSPGRILVAVSNRRRRRARSNQANRRTSQNSINRSVDVVEVSMTEPPSLSPVVSAAQPRPPAPEPNHDETRTGRVADIICPICYDALGNRPAISTSCGHVYCAECLLQALRVTKKCPVCKRGLTRPHQMHPLYFCTQ